MIGDNQMKTITNLTLVFFLLVVLFGCSPSDEGGGSSGSSTKSYSLAEGGTVRNITPGYSITHTGSLTARQGTSSATADYQNIRSTADGGILQYSSNPIVVISNSRKLTDKSSGQIEQSVSQDYYVTASGKDYWVLDQGANGLWYAVNQLQGLEDPTAKIVYSGSHSTYLTLNTCSSVDSNYSCINPTTVVESNGTWTKLGIETITTSLGTFETYKISETITQTSYNTSAYNNASISSIIWYYPDLGIVKREYTAQFNDYSPPLINEVTTTLKSTNNSKYSRNQRGITSLTPMFISPIIIPIK